MVTKRSHILKQTCNWTFLLLPGIKGLNFQDLFESSAYDNNYEDLSYDVKSLFTSIVVQETIDCILYKLYVKKELKPFFKKMILRKLFNKLTKECVISVNNKLIKQTDGCLMGRPISDICCAFRFLCLQDGKDADTVFWYH